MANQQICTVTSTSMIPDITIRDRERERVRERERERLIIWVNAMKAWPQPAKYNCHMLASKAWTSGNISNYYFKL